MDSDEQTRVLRKCNRIGNRMLDAICAAIPEWQNASSDVAIIRKSVVCMFENVENILGDLIRMYRNIKTHPDLYELNDAVNASIGHNK